MNIFKVEFNNQFKGLLIWSTTMAAMLIMFIAFFPSMANSQMQQLVGAKLDALPPALLQAFNLSELPNFTDLNQYFAYCAQYLNLAGCIYAAILGASSLIKEETDGTIEFLYAKPVSRNSIVTSKLLSNLSILLIYTIIMFIVCAIALAVVAPKNYSFISELIIIIKSGYMVEVIFFAISFALSTILPSSRQATPVALSVFFITYLLGIFSGVVEKLEFLKYLSPYKYALPSDVIKEGYIMSTSYILMIIAILTISITFTYWQYKRKDMHI